MEQSIEDGVLYKQKVKEALAQEEANTISPDQDPPLPPQLPSPPTVTVAAE